MALPQSSPLKVSANQVKTCSSKLRRMKPFIEFNLFWSSERKSLAFKVSLQETISTDETQGNKPNEALAYPNETRALKLS